MREGDDSPRAWTAVDGIFATLQGIEPTSPSAVAFYDDSVRQLNVALDARRNRLDDAGGGLPWVIGALLFVGSLVIVGYAVLIGSRSYWFHAIGAGSIAAHHRHVARRARRPDLSVLGRSGHRFGAIPERHPRAVLRSLLGHGLAARPVDRMARRRGLRGLVPGCGCDLRRRDGTRERAPRRGIQDGVAGALAADGPALRTARGLSGSAGLEQCRPGSARGGP